VKVALTQYEPNALWHVASVGHLVVPPTRRHWWDNYRRDPIDMVTFQVVLAGRLQFVELDRTTTLMPGDAFLFGHKEPTEYGLPDDREEDYVCEWVCLRGAGLQAHLDMFRRRYGSVIRDAVRSPVVKEMQKLMELADIRAPTPPTSMAVAVHRFVMTLFEQMDAQHDSTRSAADRAVDQIIRHPTTPWSLKTLAGEFGVTREHLSRVFTDRVGESPSVFLSRVRLQMAAQLLKETDLSIQDIARQTGFVSARSFANQFRQFHGATPLAWRTTSESRKPT